MDETARLYRAVPNSTCLMHNEGDKRQVGHETKTMLAKERMSYRNGET